MSRVRSWSHGGSRADATGWCQAASFVNPCSQKRAVTMQQTLPWLTGTHPQLPVSLQVEAARSGKWGS
eukprot:1272923-Prymnesium_polylepis.1